MNIKIGNQLVSFDEILPVTKVGESGDKPKTLIFLHGWGGSKQSLRRLAEMTLPEAKKILLDLPGFGESENPPKDWGITQYTNLIHDFLKNFGFSNVDIIGHSFGGSIALKAAASHTPHIRKIVTIAPSWIRKEIDHTKGKYSLIKPIFDKLPLLKRGVYKVFFPDSDLMRYPELQDNFKKIVNEDLTEEIRNLTTPTLIIWGSEDSQTPVENAKLLHSLLPHSRLEIIEGHKHNIPVKYPDLLERQINEFLRT
ncbi:MAG: alpha/beta hydrolase [Patescibacteria group bacterium]